MQKMLFRRPAISDSERRADYLQVKKKKEILCPEEKVRLTIL